MTSPPYFGLRSYGVGAENGEIGCEPTPDAFVAAMVRVFREVRRVLRDDGTCWLNLGDTYSAARWSTAPATGIVRPHNHCRDTVAHPKNSGLPDKNLIGIPWRVAFALQADGWYLRDAIVWAKATVDADGNLEGSAMPGSQRDRCTSAYEMLFQLTKSSRYYFDIDAVKTKSGALPRNVWRLNPKPFKGCHFAVMPPKLVEPCIKAGCPAGGTVLDPFAGAGTVGLVAKQLGRSFVGIELNAEYAAMAGARIAQGQPQQESTP